MLTTDRETAVFKVFIKGPIDAVWREITKTDEPQGCMFNTQLHTDGLKPGGQIRMRTKSGKYTAVMGEILEFDPPHRYAHTHRFTMHDDPVCQVVYELKPVDGGVEVTLRVLGLPVGTPTDKAMASGGHDILARLKAIAPPSLENEL